jgi:hypothetical protein
MQGPSKDQLKINSLKVAGDSIEISYTTGTLTGSSLSYRDDQIDRTFTNAEITVEETTAFGQLITVTISDAPDAPVVRFTLVLPPITVPGFNEAVDVEVAGATVTQRSLFTPEPQHGQQTSYSFVTLTGTAQAQVF